jgi:hypothetical protein
MALSDQLLTTPLIAYQRKGHNMTESTSPATTVVGLFRARGDAENARNRLKTEGLASEDRMVLKVLKETATPTGITKMELDSLSLDPFFDILEGLRHEYVSCIRNGETALKVRELTADAAKDVARILGYFDPLRVDVISEKANTA